LINDRIGLVLDDLLGSEHRDNDTADFLTLFVYRGHAEPASPPPQP